MFSGRKIDAIVVPTTIISAPSINDNVVSVGKNVVIETRQALLQNTIVFNSTGLPAISVPIGLTKEKMPVGVQIIGPPFREDIILSIAYCYEQKRSSTWIHLFHNYIEKAINLCHYYDNFGLPTTGKFTGFHFFYCLKHPIYS